MAPRDAAGALDAERVVPLLVARIVAVADVFDALVSERPYKHAWPVSEGIDYLKAQRGRHFDPRCVDAFLADPNKIDAIIKELGD